MGNSTNEFHENGLNVCLDNTPVYRLHMNDDLSEHPKKKLKVDASTVADSIHETWLKLDTVH